MTRFISAEFAVEPDPQVTAQAIAEGGFVLRSGKYFELGDYPDKQFSLNEQEADVAIGAFKELPINLEHMPTLFDDKLGQVRRMWRKGKDLFAEYAIPNWLHAVTGGEPIRISSEWDRFTKRPVAAALVLSPRISDAVMMAAFRQDFGSSDTVPTSSLEMRKEIPRMGLLARFTAFLKGEGLIKDEFFEEPPPAALSSTTVIPHSGTEPVANPMPELVAPFSSLQFSQTAEFRQMSETIKQQAGEIEKLRADFAQQSERDTLVSHNAALSDLVQQGKLTASECTQWQEVAAGYPVAFTAVLATLQARQALPQFSGQPTRKISPSADAPADQLVALSKERCSQTGERFDAAFSKVCRENPELAAAHAAGAPSYSFSNVNGGAAHE